MDAWTPPNPRLGRYKLKSENVKSKETNFLPADRQLMKQTANLNVIVVGNGLGSDNDLIN